MRIKKVSLIMVLLVLALPALAANSRMVTGRDDSVNRVEIFLPKTLAAFSEPACIALFGGGLLATVGVIRRRILKETLNKH